ncbi:MAG: ORF6N domain-containing protein [Bacteroidales bacterium]|nr:ORF6N domain-containing protein [Bacteroidales bacterium]
MNKNNILIPVRDIENRIFTIRGLQVMLDSHLAEMYNIETKVFNQSVKRNIERFPENFRFQLTENEWESLRSQNATLEKGRGKHRKYIPYVFTENGVAMLASVLKSETAIKVSIAIITAFVEMRKFILEKAGLFQRLDRVELKQIETDQKFEQVFKALESKKIHPDKGIFFDGQVFDAWVFISELTRKATKNITMIDNYIDETVLSLFAKKQKGVSVDIYTKNISRTLHEDAKKFNAQYGGLSLHAFNAAHDRFLLIDKTEVYHIGASLKDLGKKWFAFSKMEKDSLVIFEKLGI